jgi:hypothetical protein
VLIRAARGRHRWPFFIARKPAIIYLDRGGLQDAARLACFRFTRKFTKADGSSGLQKMNDVNR